MNKNAELPSVSPDHMKIHCPEGLWESGVSWHDVNGIWPWRWHGIGWQTWITTFRFFFFPWCLRCFESDAELFHVMCCKSLVLSYPVPACESKPLNAYHVDIFCSPVGSSQMSDLTEKWRQLQFLWGCFYLPLNPMLMWGWQMGIEAHSQPSPFKSQEQPFWG